MITPPRVEKSWFWGQIDAEGDCWIWTGGKSRGGYGQTKYNGTHWGTHRLVWTMLVADIAEGEQLDHLCTNPPCCNPDHLEPVSQEENLLRMRKSRGREEARRCHRGHTRQWQVDNRGQTYCVGCQTQRSRDHRERKRTAE